MLKRPHSAQQRAQAHSICQYTQVNQGLTLNVVFGSLLEKIKCKGRMMIEYIADSIKKADLVLVGLGEELDLIKSIRKEEKYREIADTAENKWIIPFVEKIMLQDKGEEKLKIYQMFAETLKEKNYFVVSICQDGLIEQAGFKEQRTVAPCGSYQKMQCSEKCNKDFYDVSKELLEQVRDFMNGKNTEAKLQPPICPVCGKPLVFNNIDAENYMEEGYLEQWMVYKKWLQGTVNKKLCVLELGAGMKYPTVIRWPFEKIVFFNQKAELFRIHSWLHQITEEIKEKGHGICQEPEEFIRELSNAL